MKVFNSNIDFQSFLQKGTKKINDDFGVSLITGYQGSGKSYFSVYVLYKYLKNKTKIRTNIKSLKIPGKDIEYFERIDEIVSQYEQDYVYIIDEISKKYTKECKQDKLFYSWLQQSRKRRRTVLLITQEYLQVPIWLRGVARYVYTTNKVKFLPIFKTVKGIAVLDKDTCEWTVEPLTTYYYKRTDIVAKMYDTMEPVQTL